MKRNNFLNKMEYVCKGYRPLSFDSNGLYLFKNGSIYLLSYQSNKIKQLVKIDNTHHLLGKFRIFVRLFRLEPFDSVIYQNILFIALHNSIYQVDLSNFQVVDKYEFRRNDIHLRRFCVIENIDGFKNGVAFGEYFSNPKNEQVNIYVAIKGEGKFSWNKCFSFKDHTIRHVHSIISDSENKCLYIFTGDSHDESGIWKVENDFKIVNPVAIGNQKYRAGTGFVHANHIIYASDSPSYSNFIGDYNLKENQLNMIFDFPGSCTSACATDKGYVFCSTVEPIEPKNHSSITMFKYYFSKKRGNGIKDNFAYVYYFIGGKLIELFKVKKDFFPGPAFQFGRAIPYFDFSSGDLLLYFVAVRKYDGKLYRVNIKNEDFIDFESTI